MRPAAFDDTVASARRPCYAPVPPRNHAAAAAEAADAAGTSHLLVTWRTAARCAVCDTRYARRRAGARRRQHESAEGTGRPQFYKSDLLTVGVSSRAPTIVRARQVLQFSTLQNYLSGHHEHAGANKCHTPRGVRPHWLHGGRPASSTAAPLLRGRRADAADVDAADEEGESEHGEGEGHEDHGRGGHAWAAKEGERKLGWRVGTAHPSPSCMYGAAARVGRAYAGGRPAALWGGRALLWRCAAATMSCVGPAPVATLATRRPCRCRSRPSSWVGPCASRGLSKARPTRVSSRPAWDPV
eukprot:scaffold49436_cov55-Phaeocystis_antarctica.AAC.4